MPRSIRLSLLVLAGCALLAACHENPAPDPPKKPDAPVGATDLRDAIHKPIDKAKSVEDKLEDEKEKQDKQLQDAGG